MKQCSEVKDGRREWTFTLREVNQAKNEAGSSRTAERKVFFLVQLLKQRFSQTWMCDLSLSGHYNSFPLRHQHSSEGCPQKPQHDGWLDKGFSVLVNMSSTEVQSFKMYNPILSILSTMLAKTECKISNLIDQSYK